MSQLRFKVSSTSIIEQEVTAVFEGSFTHKVERNRIYYLHEIAGNPALYGADYTLIKDLADDCEEIAFIVERFCEGSWVEYWRGKFTKFDCKFDYYKCRLQISVKPNSTYQCIFDGWDLEENIYTGTGDEIQVQEFFGTYETVNCCYACLPFGTPVEPVCLNADACEEITVYQEVTSPPEYPGDCELGDFYAYTCYHRILGTGTALDPPIYGTGWTLLSGTTWWKCPDEDLEQLNIGVLRLGRRFDAVLEYLVSQLGCSLTVRSHFFGINATHAAAPVNDAYDYAGDYYQDMTIHQKSDVKRPYGDPSFSFIWNMKLKDLLNDLQTMFNVFWKLDGTDLILEHITYFESIAGADYSAVKMPLELEYDINAPKTERFVWSDEDCSAIFKGSPITYNCGNGDNERRVSLFSTDVGFVRNISYQDRVSDDNWVLLSCSNTGPGGIYFINERNQPLSWTNLHDKLHRHWRPFTSGTLNGVAVTFDSVEPIKKQPEFTVPLCCDAVFDPSAYITTQIGDGTIQSATENLYRDTLKLQLNY